MATAFTSAQRANIRLYLGWSARFHQFDSRLEQAMNAIDSEPDDSTHDIIVGLLASLDDMRTRIVDAYGRLKAQVVGSITLPGPNEIAMLRSEGRRLANQVASVLGVATRHDAFSSASNRTFAGFSDGGGGGNEIKQG